MIINIELDGLDHEFDKKIRFCLARDEYLTTKGMVIGRIDSTTLSKMKNVDIEDWTLNLIANSVIENSII